MSQNRISVFTKPWPSLSLAALGKHVRELGFDAIELPVRPGYQVDPEQVQQALPKAVRELADQGVAVSTVAGSPSESLIAACGEAGVRVIRAMVSIRFGDRFMAVLDRTAAQYESLVPLLEQASVTLGVQNHSRRMISSTMGLRYLVGRFDPRHISGVLDFGHCGLAGEEPDEALDQILPHLALVNFKNGYWHRAAGPEASRVKWSVYWTTGPYGMCPWPSAVAALRDRDYNGDICLTAEYSDRERVDELVQADLAYLRQCFAEAQG